MNQRGQGPLHETFALAYRKGFSRSNLFMFRKFCLTYPKIKTPSGQSGIAELPSKNLSWSHNTEILKADNELEISFSLRQCDKENWSVRELKRQMKSMLFHRQANSKDKTDVLDLAKNGAGGNLGEIR